MRIFFAGATGAVGRRLLPRLIADGHQVVAMVRSEGAIRDVEKSGAVAALADAMDAQAVRRAVLAAQPEVVMHQLTSLASGDFAANAALRIDGTRHLADAAEESGVRRFIVQSINWVYEPGDTPATEDVPLDLGTTDPRRALSVQGITELERQAARSPEWVALRYGTFYGPDTWYAPPGAFAELARGGELTATADVTSFVHVDDAAEAAVAALHWPTGVVNVCDDEPAAGLEWVPVFCAAVGAAPPPIDDAPRAGFARGADNTLARQSLGWSPSWASWRDGFDAFAH